MRRQEKVLSNSIKEEERVVSAFGCVNSSESSEDREARDEQGSLSVAVDL